MRTYFAITLLVTLVPYIIYRTLVGMTILGKKRKYNKSNALADWYFNSNPIKRFFLFGSFDKVKIEKHKYKVLKDDEQELENKST